MIGALHHSRLRTSSVPIATHPSGPSRHLEHQIKHLMLWRHGSVRRRRSVSEGAVNCHAMDIRTRWEARRCGWVGQWSPDRRGFCHPTVI